VSRREQVFWGWGEPGAGPPVPARMDELLRSALGVSGEVVSRPVALEDVRLREPALEAAVRARLEAIVGEGAVRSDREGRVLRCRGKGYLDLVAQRAGDCLDAPDAVVAPGGREETREVLRVCNEAGVAVVPFGGGTSVVGGLEPLRDGFGAVVSLDLGRMDRLVAVDERSLTAVLEPGLRLPEADRGLAAHGLTLAHVPQSYEWATVGGCVATRSAGQSSTGHGRIDDNVVALELVTPVAELSTRAVPASAAGPSLRELVVGSEGTLGVIAGVTLRVRRVAAARRYEGWFLRSFADGCEALRRLEQLGAAPDVARLSDEPETAIGMALAHQSAARRAGMAVLRGRGYASPALLVTGWEGAAHEVRSRRRATARLLRRSGAAPLGRGPGEAWAAARFAGPFTRDHLLDRGVLVETLETATTWSGLEALHGAVRDALAGALEHSLVGCHVSHLYPTGASLYFTVLAPQDRDDPAGQWGRAKAAATDAIVAGGATITHHHAVGRDHAPWLPAEAGAAGVGVLRTLKDRLDPAGIMNPGKLLPPG
jgi:alkyldihydroxyacetonephosphate synthase